MTVSEWKSGLLDAFLYISFSMYLIFFTCVCVCVCNLQWAYFVYCEKPECQFIW